MSGKPLPAKEINLMSRDEAKSFMEDIDAVIFDCDGVLWLENEPLENAYALVLLLRSMKKKVFFLTNNSTKTKEELLVKFKTMGFDAKEDEILSAAYLTALYLKELGFKRKAYVIGCPSIVDELALVGIESIPVGPDPFPTTNKNWTTNDIVQDVNLDADVGAVVIGFDHHFSYVKALKAASYLNRKSSSGEECLFIGTDADENIPGPSGVQLVFPGGGALIATVKACSGRTPTIIGKPEVFPFKLIQKKYALDPKRVMMIGDRGNTDILFGRKCGLRTLLVLSGVTSEIEMHRWEKSDLPAEVACVPEYYANHINEFYQLLKS